MGWKEDLLAASFRGVPFSVDGHQFTTGRNTVVDELAYSDVPFAQDLGRATRRFRVEAFVVGDDYFRDRDRLLAALEGNAGPGELIHPYHGVRTVRVLDVQSSESAREGRFCRLSIEFVEVENPRTRPRAPASPTTEEGALRVQDAADVALEDGLVVSDVPQETIDATASEISKIGKLIEGLGTLGGLADEAAALGELARNLTLKATSLALAPIDLALALRTAIDSVADTVANGLDALRVYKELEALVPSVFASDQEQANADLVVRTAQLSALAGWARALESIDWASYDDSLAARRTWEERADAQILDSSGELFDALSQLAAAVASSVPPPERDLPRVATFTPPSTMPAVVIAYRLYGDPERAADLIARNRIRNPLMVAGGVPLEVLTRE